MPALVDLPGHPRDLLGLVADALQVRDRLADRHDETQVSRRGLALDDDVAAIVVDPDLVLVDASLVRNHLVDQVLISVRERVDGPAYLGLHQAAHLQNPRAQGLEVVVVLLGKVFAAHSAAPRQPNRPVM